MNGIQEVSGSIPLISTIESLENTKFLRLLPFSIFGVQHNRKHLYFYSAGVCATSPKMNIDAQYTRTGMIMENTIKLPALDADVRVADNMVHITFGDNSFFHISIEEWESARIALRFDDSVDYENGETPMTGLQFRSFIELTRDIKGLEAEKERLMTEMGIE